MDLKLLIDGVEPLEVVRTGGVFAADYLLRLTCAYTALRAIRPLRVDGEALTITRSAVPTSTVKEAACATITTPPSRVNELTALDINARRSESLGSARAPTSPVGSLGEP